MASREKIADLLDSNPEILRLLVSSDSLGEARHKMFDYLHKCEETIFDPDCPLHPLEKKNTRDCVNVFKNIIAPGNEKKTGHSCLKTLWDLATEHWRKTDWPEVSDAFLIEMQHLFKGIIGLSGIYSKSGICRREVPEFVNLQGRDSAVVRSNFLNRKAEQYQYFIRKNEYRSGLDPDITEKRIDNRKRILECLKGSEDDWNDYKWHRKNGFRSVEMIERIVELSVEENDCLREAASNGIPMNITPFYLSMIDVKAEGNRWDFALRTHVIPNRTYIRKMAETGQDNREELDFMNEMDTSPVDLVTRRYPKIAIIKPSMSCPQICVYCQRNWELEDSLNKHASRSRKLDKAYKWFQNNTDVHEVLITGGDPLNLSDEEVEAILGKFAEMEHVKRIRIGTRTLVTMPMRFNDQLMETLKRIHNPPNKTITIVTHVQHAYEISQEMVDAVRKIKACGIDIHNQQVFTIQNCRKFETSFLRESLKNIGITPYYLFNLKGKNETSFFKVPIARLLQEQKEEARIMSGLVRTDKPVFNVPKLGKNDLASWQDHDVIMVMNDGSRIYEFFPWEKYLVPVNTFLYKDEPIADFLDKLESRGESAGDYKTIWYYY